MRGSLCNESGNEKISTRNEASSVRWDRSLPPLSSARREIARRE